MIAILWILASLCAAVYGLWLVHTPEGLLRSICKALATATLTGISGLSGGPVLLTFALAFGTLGDIALSRSGNRAFLAGLTAFLVGHLAYVVLFISLADPAMFLSSPARWGGTFTLAATGVLILKGLWTHLGRMRGPVALYGVVSVAMGTAAIALPWGGPFVLILLGALCFIASDAILGFELFAVRKTAQGRLWPATLLWFLYWGGQALILKGVVLTASQSGGV